jgi:hypothetical protein
LIAIADEILAIIKSDSSEQKKKADSEILFGEKIKEDLFIDLSNLANTITDYTN